MKKLTFFLMLLMFSLSIFPTQMMAAEKDPITATANTKEIPAEVKAMLNRLD